MDSNVETVTEYLKVASDLENTKYMQERVLEKARRGISLRETKMPYVSKPVSPSEYLVRPKKPDYKDEDIKYNGIGWGLLFIAIGLPVPLFTAFHSVFLYNILFNILCIGSIILGVFIIHGSFRLDKENKKENAELREKYNKELVQYNEKLTKEESKHQEDSCRYHREMAEARRVYYERKEDAKRCFEAAQAEIESMEVKLAETETLLDRLYSEDVLFPKYRNMVAVSMMYEYFVAGRVSELTGPNGAYNLYEAELRQNLIINKMDKISSQLEDIKDNQYVLYQAVSLANSRLREVVDELEQINDGVATVASNTGRAASSAKLAAYYAEITAKNTEALKFIELVS